MFLRGRGGERGASLIIFLLVTSKIREVKTFGGGRDRYRFEREGSIVCEKRTVPNKQTNRRKTRILVSVFFYRNLPYLQPFPPFSCFLFFGILSTLLKKEKKKCHKAKQTSLVVGRFFQDNFFDL